MASKLSQSSRPGSFKCDLGDDVLFLSRFEGSEGLSELFEYRVDLVSENKNIDLDKLLGTVCTVAISSNHPGVKRYFSGLVTEVTWTGYVQKLRNYRVVLRPKVWLLTRKTNCRIFSDMTASEIIDQVLGEHGITYTQDHGGLPKMEYCVQYRESDFAFIARLMEEYGIFYYFDHSASNHEMKLKLSSSSAQPKPAGAALALVEADINFTRDKDLINAWTDGRKFRSGKVTLKDYNYEKPDDELLTDDSASSRYQNGMMELFDYPGRYIAGGDGKLLSSVRLEAEQATDKRAHAEGDAITCCPGFQVEISGLVKAPDGNKFLVARANHIYRSQSYQTAETGGEDEYFGHYEFQPLDIPFRAPALTPKPLIHGPQTALVVSDVDKDCRIEVQFFWDREKTPSRYVRIAQAWAGDGWGDVKIPRIGMEVVVEFLNGDPDHPLVTGSVYNGNNKPPYVPDKLNNVSGTKSQTIGGSGYNELIMDDTAGSELIRFHAQKDLDGTVLNDERRDIKHDVNVKIGNNRDESIGSTWTVKAKQKIEFIVGEGPMASTFTMTPTEITLKAMQVKLDAQALLSMKSAALGELKTTAPLTIEGALVFIN